MDRAYVSEFMVFMNQYLKEHPEVVKEQQHGWKSFWEPRVDLTPPKITKEDVVQDDSYGFSWSAWRAESLAAKKHAESGKAE